MAAKRKRRRSARGPDRPGPVPTAIAVVGLRVYAGLFFLATAAWKLFQPGYSLGEKIVAFRDLEYLPFIDRAVAYPPELWGHPLSFFAAFLDGVMRPLAGVAAPGILFFELLLGVGLVVGGGVRLLGALGFLLMLVFSLGKPQPGLADPDAPVGVFLLTVKSANWPITWLLLALALLAAGRTLGIDAWIRARGPAWLRWTA